MRWVIGCLVAIGVAQSALAADYREPFLRGSQGYVVGPPAYHRWSGFYGGAQVGYSTGSANFTNGVSDLVAEILRFTTVEDEFDVSQWASLPKQAITRSSFGGFVGHNWQFEDTILGIELNYNRASMSMASGDTISRVVVTSDGYSNDVTVTGTGSIRLIDYGTIRARFGWLYENLLPYGFFGVAVGRADVMRSASVTIFGTDADPGCVGPPNVCLPPFAFADSRSEAKLRAIGYGWTLGGGVDWELLPHVFVRGEYEFVGFPSFQDVRLNLHTVRGAVGVKF